MWGSSGKKTQKVTIRILRAELVTTCFSFVGNVGNVENIGNVHSKDFICSFLSIHIFLHFMDFIYEEQTM